MVNIVQIDKSGRDVFEKDYSIVVVVNNNNVYGVNISQEIKDIVLRDFRRGDLGIFGQSERSSKIRLRVRFHTVVIILILREIVKRHGSNFNIQICNDFDGHFHEIKYTLFSHLSKIVDGIRSEDIVQAKFQKPSFIDSAGKNIRNKATEAKKYNIIKLKKEEILKLMKK